MNELTRQWDARWTHAEQDEAVRAADEQTHVAKSAIFTAIRGVETATHTYSNAVRWAATIRGMRDADRKREAT